MVQVEEVSKERLIAAIREAGAVMEPASGMQTLDDLASGFCIKLSTARGDILASLTERNGVLWVDSAVGGRAGAVVDGLAFIEALAQQRGCTHTGFATRRAGLVRQAKRAGFEIVGVIMKKAV